MYPDQGVRLITFDGRILPVICVILVTSAFTGCLDGDEDGDEWKPNWQMPAYIGFDVFDYDGSTGSWTMRLVLASDEFYVTQRTGDLTLAMFDEDLKEVYNQTWTVKAKHFTIEVSEGQVRVWDTWYDIVVGDGDIFHGAPVIEDPEYHWDVLARFAFEGKTLVSERRWLPPDMVHVYGVTLDPVDNEYDVTVRLSEESDLHVYSTKASGFLTLTLTDGIGTKMYHHRHRVDAGAFTIEVPPTKLEGFDRTLRAELALTIPMEDIEESGDTFSPYHGRMFVNVTFEGTGFIMSATDHTPPYLLTDIDIPEHLIRPKVSTPPVAAATHPDSCISGEVMTFDASISSDPENDIVLYKWDWDDPTHDNQTYSPVINHTMHKEGEHNIVLTVVDSGGNENSTVLHVVVGPAFVVTFLEVGLIEEPGSMYNHTFIRLTIQNMASEARQRPGSPDFEIRDSRYSSYNRVDMDGDVPYEFQASQTVEVTVYYVKHGPGDAPLPIDPASMRVWGNVYPPEWLDIPEEVRP